MVHSRAALFSFILALAMHAPRVDAQTSADSGAIKQVALDYIEGWYEGNGEGMERALHSELAKRIVNTDARSGRSVLEQQDGIFGRVWRAAARAA